MLLALRSLHDGGYLYRCRWLTTFLGKELKDDEVYQPGWQKAKCLRGASKFKENQSQALSLFAADRHCRRGAVPTAISDALA